MVNRRTLYAIAFLSIAIVAAGISNASGQTRVYHFNYEYAKLWMNPDTTIDLFYNISLTVDSGQQIRSLDIGQPTGDFKIGESFDQNGQALQTSDVSSNGQYLVNVALAQPLTAGNTIWFTLTTNVGGMIRPDSKNPGNLGMIFAPEWRTDVPLPDVRVQIVLPPNASVKDAVTLPDKFWNATSVEPDGRAALYWETPLLNSNQEYDIGVSLPASFFPGYVAPSSGGTSWFIVAAAAVGLIIVFIVVGVVLFTVNKRPYTNPKVSMETLGVRRGLTAVEASYLLDFKPTQIVTETLYSLLQKRAVWVESANPTLKLKIMPQFQDKKGPSDSPLRYYEIDFLEAIKPDGALDEEKLAHAIMYLRDTLEQKLSGYSRKDTAEYYKRIADKAWTQVEQAGTGDLASKAYDEQLLWLLLDPNFKGRTQTTFTSRPFEPNPMWFWWWYGYTNYNPHPVIRPNIEAPAQSAKPPSIPGADFANNIATSVEKTSGGIVADLEKFASSIIPPKPSQSSHQPAHSKADCVCACAACACACACVSCACACAGGGAH